MVRPSTGGTGAARRGTGAILLLMIVSGALLASLAPYTRYPMLLAAGGLIPLFILARIGPVGVALTGGVLWGLVLAGANAVLPARANAGVPNALLGFGLTVCCPGLFAWLGAWITRRFGFRPFVLGVAWYAIECGSAELGQSFTARESLALGASWYHSIAAALGYTFLALLISWLTATVVTVLEAAVRATCAMPGRVVVAIPGDYLLRLFDEIPFLRSLLASLGPRAPPYCRHRFA